MSAFRVLIVDDNLMNIELVTFLLKTDGFEVGVAHDAIEALRMVPTFEPDLILMDIQLPGMDGLELTRHLRAVPATAHLPIVAFTAYAMKGDEHRMLEAGCDGYIAKPIDVASFAPTVRGYAEGRRR